MVKILVNRYRRQAQYFIENLGNGVELEMVLIPKGSFMMGSPEDELQRSPSESPQHQVNIKPFCMGKYPITQAQWQAVAALPQVNGKLMPNPSNFRDPNQPVERVPWYDAVEFCQHLSQKTGREYRLPSEAEWEYACRARTTTPFHFGETITDELANYNANHTYGAGVKGKYRRKTIPVGRFQVANAFGLYDMHGNVWEWCADHWHDDYKGAPDDGSSWLDANENQYHVLRGGSWLDYPNDCRSAHRAFDIGVRHYFVNHVGFRVVCAGAELF